MTTQTPSPARSVAVITLGCARNEVDSEELAGRLAAQGWQLVDDAEDADVAVVNTCGFIEQAKKDSIDALLETADLKGRARTKAVVAVGCLAERYGEKLAAELPEADAVLGFDSYRDLSDHLGAVLEGRHVASHVPSDRRRLLPLAPVDRPEAAAGVSVPGHGGSPTAPSGAAGGVDAPGPESSPPVVRALLDHDRPWAPVKIASGCDRRCSFCAIPSFRGSFISRRPADILAEARWLGEQGVKEVFLVSENTTSYGKDLGDIRLLETLLPELAAVPGIDRVRVSYLQPAEIRPGLIDVMVSTPGVVPYFDISFQHCSESVLRRMRRFGSPEAFLGLVESIRARVPAAGIRSNVIVGFPGETEADVAELEAFLTAARLDVVGVFGYSDEEGTSAVDLDDKVDEDVIAERVARVTDLVEELTSQRAEERIGDRVAVLVESVEETDDGELLVLGRAPFQGPEVDGACELVIEGEPPSVGDVVLGVVIASDGVDLIVEAV